MKTVAACWSSFRWRLTAAAACSRDLSSSLLFNWKVLSCDVLNLLVLLAGLHHDEVPLVVQPVMQVVVMSLFKAQIQHEGEEQANTSFMFSHRDKLWKMGHNEICEAAVLKDSSAPTVEL